MPSIRLGTIQAWYTPGLVQHGRVSGGMLRRFPFFAGETKRCRSCRSYTQQMYPSIAGVVSGNSSSTADQKRHASPNGTWEACWEERIVYWEG